MPSQVVCENDAKVITCLLVIHPGETGPFPGLGIAFDNESAGVPIELIGMRGKDTSFVLAERERESMEQLVGAIPNITIRPDIEFGFEPLSVVLPHRAVDSVCRYQQIAMCSQQIDVDYFRSEGDFDIQFRAAALENLEKLQTFDSGKAIAVNGDLAVALDDIDIVPSLEGSGNLGVRLFVCLAEICQRPFLPLRWQRVSPRLLHA